MAATHDTDRYLERVAKVQWGIMLSIFCVSHAPAISLLDFNRFASSGPLMLVYFLMMIFFGDLFAVLMSSILGGKPLMSNPNKTSKGVFVGSFITLLCGLALYWLTPFRLWQAGLMTLAIIVSGIMGDLVISSVKRVSAPAITQSTISTSREGFWNAWPLSPLRHRCFITSP